MVNENRWEDIDPIETKEWLDALDSVLRNEGEERATFLLSKLQEYGKINLNELSSGFFTPYCNTISSEEDEKLPDATIERSVRGLIRWNALAMVLRAGQKNTDLGGHIASYASAAVLYEIGFNHFFRAQNEKQLGDLLFLQGHSSPGIYARAFLEGRITEQQLENFRQEVNGNGLSSYPHPWLMPSFWEFPTVSMGLGAIQAIYQARFDRYLINRGLIKDTDRKIWAFLGDGEMDEPESLGSISIAAREKLDNLIFVVNCNLQRLDGPVRGNGKIIQELEGIFKGAGWNVIKVIWGSKWDALLKKDSKGLLLKRMQECLDGDYQSYKTRDGHYVREHFFGKYPELAAMVADYTDEEIWELNRGGHDPKKVYSAYKRAVQHRGSPTVLLIKTVKGFGMGVAGEGRNITHQLKKLDFDELKSFRDRFRLPLSDEQVRDVAFFKPSEDSPEIQYIHKQRKKLGGYLPSRQVHSFPLDIPSLSTFDVLLKGSGDRAFSTTMAMVRILTILLKDPKIGSRIVPIVPDECRTFGMEGLFRQYGIYSPLGQMYTPEDAEQLMFYREAKNGQILEEGINEAGAFCSWLAAATSYQYRKLPMIPFFIYYSMFGFQRIGDLAWAAGDMRARGILVGGTSGRTTLAGEGLQHTDGHSHIMAGTIPNCISYDPTYAYELAVIVQHALKRMYEQEDDVFYYITVMNENYNHPAIPSQVEEGIIKGMYLLRASSLSSVNNVQLLGSGAILREVLAAAEYLEQELKIACDVWSVTSFNELKRQAMHIERRNRLNPTLKPKNSYVFECLASRHGPVIAATDYIRAYADQIRSEIPHKYVVLGTDGFGRSDTRENLRKFFEVDRDSIVLTTLYTLYEEGKISIDLVSEQIKLLGIKSDLSDPFVR